MFVRFFLFGFFFFCYFLNLNLNANEKQLIVNRLLEINNLTFQFEQIIKGDIETGNCFLVFDNKLKCKYVEEIQKEIIVNDKTLVVIKKKYNKIYFYPLSKSPFVKILNKNNLIKFIKESKLELKENINLTYTDKEKQGVTIFFSKKNYELLGWKIKDTLQNEIYFLLKIQNINTQINDSIFQIPSPN